ncbi:unnamed protein product [Mesocestoides corti]|uniref:Uncharacterized protein n=1 Tax=Mesocestoides corti TaxID=53468 RepID=A0A0R3UJ93_MESCO|nr:unnamed protein product [Mesocestoides corti]
MDSSDDVIEVPIEVAQEYITTALGFAPLHLSDLIYNIFTDSLCSLVESAVGALSRKYEDRLTQANIDALMKMVKIKLQGQQNVLFDQLDSFLISDVFFIDENAVLMEDMPQVSYSKKKHALIKASIEKHEKNIMMVCCVAD